MAKKEKKKRELKEISMTPLLWLGFLLVIGLSIVNSVFPNFPKPISAVLYVVGLLALIVYMWQKAFERRTGYEELPENKKSSRKSK